MRGQDVEKKLIFILGAIIVAIIMTGCSEEKLGVGGTAGYPDGWNKCKNITINNPGATTLTDFTSKLNITYDADMQADFDDLRFYTGGCGGTGNQLYAEIEMKTDSTNAYVWIKNNLTAGANIISMYYGNSSISSGFDASGNAWDSSYIAVWLFGVNARDSKNVWNGTVTAALYNNTKCMWGGCYIFDGVSDYITVGDLDTIMTAKNWTYEVLFRTSDVTHASQFMFKTNSFATNVGGDDSDTYIQDRVVFGAKYTNTNWVTTNNATYYASISYSNSSGAYVFTGNGVTQTNTGTTPAIPNSADSLTISRNSATEAFLGYIDELKVSNIVRSSDWINMSYQLTVNHASFVTYGTEENETVVSTNTCTYTSGDWFINATDHCNLTSTNLGGNDVNITGSTADECCTRGLRNLTNYTYLRIEKAYVYS
jgi:hypothetical protein